MDLQTTEMLKKIVLSGKEYLSTETLMDFLSVSDRTVYNYWKKILKFLQDIGAEQFFSCDGKGFAFTGTEKDRDLIAEAVTQMSFYDYHLNSEERPWVIFLYLCTESSPVTIENFETILCVSRTTVITALRAARALAEEHHLSFRENTHYGISLEGNEFDRRELILKAAETLHVKDSWYLKGHSFNPFTTLFEELFHLNKYEQITRSSIQNLKTSLDLHISDRKFYRLSFLLCLIMSRMSSVQSVFFNYRQEDYVQHELLADTLLQSLKKESAPDSYEIRYLAYKLKGLHITEQDITNKYSELYISMIVKHLLQRLEFHYKTPFNSDTMLSGYLCAHIRACYRRVMEKERLCNPLLEDIKKEYPNDFDLLKNNIYILENSLNISLNDDEIAYILMHILAAVERKKANSYIPGIVVACNTGMATGSLLAALIQKRMNVRIVAICQIQNLEEVVSSNDVDLVVSTIPASCSSVRTLVLNAIPTENDFRNLHSAILSLQENIQAVSSPILVQEENEPPHELISLNQLIDTDSILLDKEASSWKEAIIAAGELLLWKRCITVNYLNSMLDLVSQYGPYIVLTKGIALAHAAPTDGHLAPGFSMVRFKEPVIFDHECNDPVSIVFSFTVPNTPAYTYTILEFMHMLRTPSFLQEMMRVKTPQEALDYILSSFHTH